MEKKWLSPPTSNLDYPHNKIEECSWRIRDTGESIVAAVSSILFLINDEIQEKIIEGTRQISESDLVQFWINSGNALCNCYLLTWGAVKFLKMKTLKAIILVGAGYQIFESGAKNPDPGDRVMSVVGVLSFLLLRRLLEKTGNAIGKTLYRDQLQLNP